MNKIRTRFAPSPTGSMHVGNLRTALYEYLIAKHEDGDFLLRIEDTDQERQVEGALETIYNTMKLTGLQHDEGPDIGGEFGPYVQSQRQEEGIYLEYAKQLIERNEAYYCFCSQERLETLRGQGSTGENEFFKYDKHCLNLSEEEVKANLDNNLPYVVRQNIPTEGTTSFSDVVYGDITVENSELDDMILIKSDGFPTYNFANVVDDHLMEITHVVRGNEYLSSTPKYTRLYHAFGWEEPVYIHCPLITNEEHKKLSKRSGHSSFEDLIEQGFLSEAIVNFIALLGWSSPSNREILSLEELIEEFDYNHINKSPAVFDMGKLKWMNGEYIKELDDERYYELAIPYIKQVIKRDTDLYKIADLVKSRIEVFPDIVDMIDFFQEVPDHSLDLYTNKRSKTNPENSLDILKGQLVLLEELEDYTMEGIQDCITQYIEAEDMNKRKALWPIRIAVSGKQVTPGGAYGIIQILGKEESIRRINEAIERLTEFNESK